MGPSLHCLGGLAMQRRRVGRPWWRQGGTTSDWVVGWSRSASGGDPGCVGVIGDPHGGGGKGGVPAPLDVTPISEIFLPVGCFPLRAG